MATKFAASLAAIPVESGRTKPRMRAVSPTANTSGQSEGRGLDQGEKLKARVEKGPAQREKMLEQSIGPSDFKMGRSHEGMSGPPISC